MTPTQPKAPTPADTQRAEALADKLEQALAERGFAVWADSRANPSERAARRE